jgi:serine/threonine protein kinase
MNLKKGTSLQNGRYRIESVLGQGGFGITYLAVQTDLDCKVAIKEFFMKDFCNRDADTYQVSVPSVGSKELVEKFKSKFIREAKSIASFHHPSIVRVSAVFEENGTAYYVMDYLEGGSLSDLVGRTGLP